MSRSDRILNVGLLVAVIGVVLLLADRLFDLTNSRGEQQGQRFVTEASWRELGKEGHRLGMRGGPIQLVVFTDFQCPYCKALSPMLGELLARYPQELTVVVRHFPLDALHPLAREAAEAAVCADRAGRFLEFHDSVFRGQGGIGSRSWTTFAVEAGVSDVAEFERCVSDRDGRAVIDRDLIAGTKLRLRGTPLILLNETRIDGLVEMIVLDSLVRAKLDR